MNGLGVIVVSAVVLAGDAVDGAASGHQHPDYDAAFVKSFPMVAGAHQIVDWKLYSALVAGDLVGYATRIDPMIARRFQQSAGKAYQTSQLEAQIRRDNRVRAAFEEQRRRLSEMVLFASSEGAGSDACRHSLLYVGNEFRLVLGEAIEGGERLLTAIIAPRCSQVLEPGLHITAGRSPRFKCWTAGQVMTCGWRLPDMPAELKGIIENEYPTSISVRWRWRGLAGVARVRSQLIGNRLPERESIALTLPLNLALEFVDRGGRIRWTAPSAGWAGAVAPHGRQ